MAELEAMPQTELYEWQRYAAIEPFGSHYDDLRAGQVAATIANANRDPKSDPLKPLDFMPWNSLAEQAVTVRGAELDAETMSALMDAELFGKTWH